MLTVGAASLSVIVMVAGGVVPWVTIGGLVRLTDSDSWSASSTLSSLIVTVNVLLNSVAPKVNVPFAAV